MLIINMIVILVTRGTVVCSYEVYKTLIYLITACFH